MIVWKTIVQSRNFLTDFGQGLKNIIGGRLKGYEVMIDDAIKQATEELNAEHPNVKVIRMQVTEMANESICVVVYGNVE